MQEMSLTLDLCQSDSPHPEVDSLACSSHHFQLPDLRLAGPALSHGGCLRIWVAMKRVSVHVEVGPDISASTTGPALPFPNLIPLLLNSSIPDPPLNPASQTL